MKVSKPEFGKVLTDTCHLKKNKSDGINYFKCSCEDLNNLLNPVEELPQAEEVQPEPTPEPDRTRRT
jgi:hypothetical protein